MAKDVANAMKQLVWSLGIKTPAEMGIKREDFIASAPKVMVDPIHLCCHTPLTEDKARELLSEVYDQKLYE